MGILVSELKKACEDNKYILVREYSGRVFGVNCKVAPLALKKTILLNDEPTGYLSFKPCTFMEYITKKIPFKHS